MRRPGPCPPLPNARDAKPNNREWRHGERAARGDVRTVCSRARQRVSVAGEARDERRVDQVRPLTCECLSRRRRRR